LQTGTKAFRVVPKDFQVEAKSLSFVTKAFPAARNAIVFEPKAFRVEAKDFQVVINQKRVGTKPFRF
jgi:hypothetical protein